jgi:hypothetical protein
LYLNGSTAESFGNDLNFRAYVDPTPVSFTGFFPPIDNDPVVNQTRAGAGVPVKFCLGGDQGLNIFAGGFPASQSVACDSFATLAPVEETGSAGQSGLTYNPSSDQYIYLWKTEKAWAKTSVFKTENIGEPRDACKLSATMAKSHANTIEGERWATPGERGREPVGVHETRCGRQHDGVIVGVGQPCDQRRLDRRARSMTLAPTDPLQVVLIFICQHVAGERAMPPAPLRLRPERRP